MPGESLAEWVHRADRALYAAKRTGRDRVLWDPDVPSSRRHEDCGAVGEILLGRILGVHVPQVDEEHRELLRLANALGSAVADHAELSVVEARVEALVQHLVFHFASEERLLELSRHPRLDHHRTLHRALIAKALDLAGEVRAGTVRADRILWFLAYDVISWHMLTTDQEFFCKTKPNGAANPTPG